MLVTVGSFKGSPGATTATLALAATWSAPCVLVEADPAGGDLLYRCRAASGSVMTGSRGVVTLAAAARGGAPTPATVINEAQQLANGVAVVAGVETPVQARGLDGLWPAVAHACRQADRDVLVDVGRLDWATPVMPLVTDADHAVLVLNTSLESVKHFVHGLRDLIGEIATVSVTPLIVGPQATAKRDCVELDALLHSEGLPTRPTQSLYYDPTGLARLHAGQVREKKSSWLLRSATQISRSVGERVTTRG